MGVEKKRILSRFVTKDGTTTILRNLSANELGNANDILAEIFDEPRNSLNERRTRKIAQENFQRYSRFFMGAFTENKIVGVIIGWPVNNLLGVHAIAVVEDYRRKGIGTALLRAFEQEARKAGFEDYVLGAREEAVPFYISRGLKCFVNIMVEPRRIQWEKLSYLSKEYDVVDIIVPNQMTPSSLIDEFASRLNFKSTIAKKPSEHITIRIRLGETSQELLEQIRRDFIGYQIQLSFGKKI